ncbi:hypothetical protein ONZ45_g1859 [Pleurotus djamor]|nr:hypothetical protein ONZ45_g1859 [Pleurotus djamor]
MSTSCSQADQPISFVSSSSARPLKRRYTQGQELDVEFFTPSASTFQPRPYSSSRDRNDKLFSSRGIRGLDSLGLHPKGTDPDPTDPTVVMIHPPFTTFPNAQNHPDGLTYQLLAENAEWFLDPVDFISSEAHHPNGIPYPTTLEPPRGWCPAKKKDLKSRGADGWPEGEEPRLRCTFCRRTYAGVNARSMWRRHVYEKHKIAMSNRRDGGDKPRGRGSTNKENRSSSVNGAGKMINMSVTSTDQIGGPSYSSDFFSVNHNKPRSSSDAHRAVSPYESRDDYLSDEPQPPTAKLAISSVTPPLSPPSPLLVDSDTSFDTSTSLASPLPNLPIIPPSPYNPLQTPSFKHAPPRLPSDQPWRFPSPSHPMHTNRELFLTIQQKTPFRSPFIKSLGETPDSVTKAYRPSPKILFPNSDKVTRFPLASRLRMRYEIDASPLHRSSKPARHRSSPGPPSDDWVPDPLVLEVTSSHDPFAETWKPGPGMTSTPPMSSPEMDSPVVHKHLTSDPNRPSGVGLGLGLLEPFRLPDERETSIDDSDFDADTNEGDDEDGIKDSILHSSPIVPPNKRRKTIG